MAKISAPVKESRITEQDAAALSVQSDATLAEWWCALNRWKWPAGLPDEEQPGIRNDKSRRWAIMCWIEDRVGSRACFREWNRDMSDEAFGAFWKKRK